MDFDHTYTSTVDDGSVSCLSHEFFPSPSATPTTSGFNHNVFHTPKNGFVPSHFTDAFTTPQLAGYDTPRPDCTGMTQAQKPYGSSDTMLNDPYSTVAGPGPLGHQVQAMPPPHRPLSSYSGPMVSPGYPAVQSHTTQPVSFSQMQTPPPTRGTLAKRVNHPHEVAFGTPSTIASRRMVTPQQAPVPNVPAPGMQSIPMQFPNLQFSPDVYQFGDTGPASAPVCPPTQILWEQTHHPPVHNRPAMLDDPFASPGMPWPMTPVQNITRQLHFGVPIMNNFQVHQQFPTPETAAAAQPQLAPPPIMISTGVDPSLVYSSPLRPAMPPSLRESEPHKALQKSDAKRRDSGNVDPKRPDASISTRSVSSAVRPELRRSHTTGTARPRSAHLSPADPLSREHDMMQPTRTSSPLKRVAKVPLGLISSAKKVQPRRSIVLTIDENGRARTETRPIAESPTRSMRDRYPGLFDSDSSDDEASEEGEEQQTPSRITSVSFSKSEKRKSKAARLDPPVENLEGLSIPPSSSFTSGRVTPSRAAVAAAAQLRRGGSLRKRASSRWPVANNSIDPASIDMKADRRHRTVGAKETDPAMGRDQIAIDAHNRRWSMMSPMHGDSEA